MRPKTVSDLLRNCVNTDSHRLILSGIAEDSGDDGVFRVATDTHRLVYCKIGDKKKEHYCKLVYPEDVYNVDGTYPNWRKVVPQQSTRSVVFDSDALDMAVRSVLVAGAKNANRIILEFTIQGTVVRARCEDYGSAVFKLARYSENNIDPFEIALNGRYLLKSIPKSGMVKLEMTENTRPIIISYPEAEGLWAETKTVIMPMALA